MQYTVLNMPFTEYLLKETNQLIYKANQLGGFSTMVLLTAKELESLYI